MTQVHLGDRRKRGVHYSQADQATATVTTRVLRSYEYVTHTHTHTYTWNTHTHPHIYLRASHISTRVDIHTHRNAHAYIYIPLHTHTHTYVYTYHYTHTRTGWGVARLLEHCGHLTQLNLKGTAVGPDALVRFSRKNVNLHSLNLSKCCRLGNVSQLSFFLYT